MRLIAVHAASLSCTPVHSMGDVEPEEYPDPVSAEGCLGAFVGVEAADAGRLEGVAAAAATELRAAGDQLNTDRVVLVPTPQVVNDPADTAVVAEAVETIGQRLEARDVRPVPPGWHLELDLRTNGHPYAVRSRLITGEDRTEDETGETDWFVASGTADGDALEPIEATEAVPDTLEPIVAGEGWSGDRIEDVLAAAGAATDDPTGDGLRWTSHGLTMRACARTLLDDRFADATPIRTPERLDPAAPAVREHLAGTDWSVDGDRVPRRTLCPGHLSAFADADLAADGLPTTLWEIGTCERGRDGRSRPAMLPEAHTVTADLDAALDVLAARLPLFDALDAAFGIDRTPVVRVTEAFYTEHRDWIEEIIAGLNGTVPVERGAFECPLSIEFVAPTGEGVVDLGWLRIDTEGPERFGVEYADGDSRITPAVVHLAPVGTIEALLATVLDGTVPAWLAPTQVRLIPIDDGQVQRCRSIAESLSAQGVRVDVDDRPRRVGERISAAEEDAVPHYAVVGEGENGETLRVTGRRDGRTAETTVEALAERIGTSSPIAEAVSRRGAALLSERLSFGSAESQDGSG